MFARILPSGFSTASLISRAKKSFLIVMLATFATACVPGVRSVEMVPSIYHLALPATEKTVRIASVKGGRQTAQMAAPLEMVKIDAESLEAALASTLSASGMFKEVVKTSTADYELRAEINRQQSQLVGPLEVLSSLDISYYLVDARTGAEVWRGHVSSQGRARGEPFTEGQPGASRKALEGAAADSLFKFVAQLNRHIQSFSPGAPVRTRFPRLETTYSSSAYGWSVFYPADWTIDASKPEFVNLKPPGRLPPAVVGFHSLTGGGSGSAPELAEAVIREWKARLQARGIRERELSRREFMLAINIPAIEIVHEIGAGIAGRSLKVIAHAGQRGLLIDAETYSHAWEVLSPYFEAMLQSLVIRW